MHVRDLPFSVNVSNTFHFRSLDSATNPFGQNLYCKYEQTQDIKCSTNDEDKLKVPLVDWFSHRITG